jgi:hypothetical protein
MTTHPVSTRRPRTRQCGVCTRKKSLEELARAFALAPSVLPRRRQHDIHTLLVQHPDVSAFGLGEGAGA